jgi:hypothetical protein
MITKIPYNIKSRQYIRGGIVLQSPLRDMLPPSKIVNRSIDKCMVVTLVCPDNTYPMAAGIYGRAGDCLYDDALLHAADNLLGRGDNIITRRIQFVPTQNGINQKIVIYPEVLCFNDMALLSGAIKPCCAEIYIVRGPTDNNPSAQMFPHCSKMDAFVRKRVGLNATMYAWWDSSKMTRME